MVVPSRHFCVFFSSIGLFHLYFAFFLFVLRIRPAVAFFFSSGGCSCPACPPPPPQCASFCCCDVNGNGNGGCGYGCGGAGGGGCANGGFTGANCACNGPISGFNNGGGSDGGGCTIQINACGAGGAIGGGGGGGSSVNCASSNGGNCAKSAAECEGAGSAEGSKNCADASSPAPSSPPCHPSSPSAAPSSQPYSTSSNCQSIQICAPAHPSSAGNSLCQPICAPNAPPAQPPTGAGGTYAHGQAPSLPNHASPVMGPYPTEPVGSSSFESNTINTFASGSHSNSNQQNVGSVDPSSFTTQQQPQIGPQQPVAALPVQPPPPAESDNQSDRESVADGIGDGYRDTGLTNGGKEDGLSLLSSKLIKVGGGSSATTTTTKTVKPTTMDWDLYEEKLPDLADYEMSTNIASGGASIGSKVTAKVGGPSSIVGAPIPTTTTTSFYTLRTTTTDIARRPTPIVWGTAQQRSTERGWTSTTTPPPTAVKTPFTKTTTTTMTTRTMNSRVMPLPSSSLTGDEREKNDLLSDDYSENSFKKAHASVQNRNGQQRAHFDEPTLSSSAAASPNVPAMPEEDPKCSSETLRAIMQENIVLSPTISKQLIFSAGRLAFGQSIDVICSKNKFSYTVVSSKIFCEASNGPVTCFSFLQP